MLIALSTDSLGHPFSRRYHFSQKWQRSTFKAEIQFWWNTGDAIYVTTKPGETSRSLHTTFPHNEDSVRWHGSFFTWLVEMLKADERTCARE